LLAVTATLGSTVPAVWTGSTVWPSPTGGTGTIEDSVLPVTPSVALVMLPVGMKVLTNVQARVSRAAGLSTIEHVEGALVHASAGTPSVVVVELSAIAAPTRNMTVKANVPTPPMVCLSIVRSTTLGTLVDVQAAKSDGARSTSMRTLVVNVTGVQIGPDWPLNVLRPFCDVHTGEMNGYPASACSWKFQSTVESRATETDWPALTSETPPGL
jgi:hypothetical protein